MMTIIPVKSASPCWPVPATTCSGVQDGAAGWESLQTYDYDLVITDNKMPRMTGVEMIGKLRSANMAVPSSWPPISAHG